MAELADAHDSKSCTHGYEGSIPSFGTLIITKIGSPDGSSGEPICFPACAVGSTFRQLAPLRQALIDRLLQAVVLLAQLLDLAPVLGRILQLAGDRCQLIFKA